MAPVLDKKSPGVQQYQIRILQWNANGIHRELPHREVLLEATNVDVVCVQETNLQPNDKNPELRNFRVVRRDRSVQRKARGGPYDIYPKADSPQNQPPTGQRLKSDGEIDDRDSTPK